MRFLVAIFAVAIVAGPASAQDIFELSGRWRTQRHAAHVDIGDCGDGSPCGVLAWVAPAVANGASTDERNPNRALRTRPLVGVPILWALHATDGGWGEGRLYNPDTGQTFRAFISPSSRRQLRVTGCLGPLCRTEIWTRIEVHEPRGG